MTRDGLEVLALGCREQLSDGMSLRQARDAVIEAGGIAVVPWGFGKWWFSRGHLLAELIDAPSPGRWFVGDNAGRPRLSRRPELFARAARHDVFVLPGSDPLPFPVQERKPGSFGFAMREAADPRQPAARLGRLLADRTTKLRSYGSSERLGIFVRNQLAMQLNKRKRGSQASRGASADPTG